MENLVLLLAIVACSALGIAVYTWIRLLRARRESAQSYETALRLSEDWATFAAEEKKTQQRLMDRVQRFETDTRDRVEEFERVASGTRERLIKLERYLKEFFEVELKTVFESFDKTVASILEEMKVELLRGVERIEDIQAVVDSKSYAQDRILDGEGSVYKLIADKDDEKAAPEEAEAAPPQTEEQVSEPAQEEPPRIVQAPPSLRLKADEEE